MKIGITGHQERDGADWQWSRHELSNFLRKNSDITGYSSLAKGADQLFANCILSAGGDVVAVIPTLDYRKMYSGSDIEKFDHLLSLSSVVELKLTEPDEEAFLIAGKWIAQKTDMMIAVWDGEAAEGTGGTADIVSYAKSILKSVFHINPIRKTSCYI